MTFTYKWTVPSKQYPSYNIKPLSVIKSYKYVYTLIIIILIIFLVKYNLF